MANQKMICPKCGGEMNHHADKLIYSTEYNAVVTNDAVFGGVIAETHNCPGCGAIAMRVVE